MSCGGKSHLERKRHYAGWRKKGRGEVIIAVKVHTRSTTVCAHV